MRQTMPISSACYEYILNNFIQDPSGVLAKLRAQTAKMSTADMQISQEQGQLMAFLVRLMGAKHALELGTFTGYSALCIAQALPDSGRLITLDKNTEWTKIARRFWKEAGVYDKIDLRLADALEALAGLKQEFSADFFDFAFIDADKVNYPTYYENVLTLLRPGGLMMIDNVLLGGTVADKTCQDEAAVAVRTLNQNILQDERVHLSMLPISDGITLVLKK